jgi:hypothetical protein
MLLRLGAMYICKEKLSLFPSPAGMSLTKLSPAGNYILNYFRSGRVWLVTSPAGDGKSGLFFTVYIDPIPSGSPNRGRSADQVVP